MDAATGRKLYGVLFLIMYGFTMWFLSNGTIDVPTLVLAPIIFIAQAIVFCMLYLATFHSENEGHVPAAQSVPVKAIRADNAVSPEHRSVHGHAR